MKRYVISGIAGAVVLGLFWYSWVYLTESEADLAILCIMVATFMGLAARPYDKN